MPPCKTEEEEEEEESRQRNSRESEEQGGRLPTWTQALCCRHRPRPTPPRARSFPSPRLHVIAASSAPLVFVFFNVFLFFFRFYCLFKYNNIYVLQI
jgi:hypothetical protein